MSFVEDMLSSREAYGTPGEATFLRVATETRPTWRVATPPSYEWITEVPGLAGVQFDDLRRRGSKCRYFKTPWLICLMVYDRSRSPRLGRQED